MIMLTCQFGFRKTVDRENHAVLRQVREWDNQFDERRNRIARIRQRRREEIVLENLKEDSDK